MHLQRNVSSFRTIVTLSILLVVSCQSFAATEYVNIRLNESDTTFYVVPFRADSPEGLTYSDFAVNDSLGKGVTDIDTLSTLYASSIAMSEIESFPYLDVLEHVGKSSYEVRNYVNEVSSDVK